MALTSPRRQYPQGRPDAYQRAMRDRYYNEPDAVEETAGDEELDELDRQISDQERLDIIERLAASLVAKRDQAIVARASSGIERIWREDELAFEGEDESSLRTRMVDYATETAPARRSKKEERRSRVQVNLVRPKTETAVGRFTDILMPTDDKCWGLKTTPVPELDEAIEDDTIVQLKAQPGEALQDADGNEVTKADIAISLQKEADKRMKSMEREINDQLTECDFSEECRKVIFDAAKAGTGILKGPTTRRRLKKQWAKKQSEDGSTVVRVLRMQEDMRPGSVRKDYWDVFPDPECREDVARAAFIWDRESILPRELRDLARIEGEGYLTDQIHKVLQQEPRRTTIAAEKHNQYVVRYNTAEVGNSYEKWEYNGELNKEDLEALGCDCSEVATASASACVVLVNDLPIKAEINPLDTGELPYDFFVWTPRSSVPWGIGICRQMLWQQRVIVAAWRMMMDNAGDTAGSNIVIGQGIEPANGVWEMTGKKVWRDTDGNVDLAHKFAQFQFSSNQGDYQAIIEMALRFADMETSIPMIFQGERGKDQSAIPETLGQTVIMVDSQNIGVRSRVRRWDDSLTRPHLTRYYDWNMQYHEDDDIKGDYEVDPRGISVLLERDQEGQSIEEILPLREDPELKDMVDWPAALKQLLSYKGMKFVLPDKDIKENQRRREQQPPPVDPQLEVAQVRANAEIEKENIRQQAEAQKRAEEFDQQLVQWQHERDLALMARENKMLELSTSSGIALDKIKAELSQVAMKLDTQVALAKDKDVKPAAQVATPIAEPGPRAAPGHAFQD